MCDKDLVLGRSEAIYFYEVDGRGPCWAFEGEKKYIGWFRGYLLAVIGDVKKPEKNTFNIYDLKNKLIAFSAVVGEVAHVLSEGGNLTVLTKDHKHLYIREKDMGSKLEMLFKKNLYTVAINLVQIQQADAAATAEVMRKYGDHLYSKQDYDEAMAQYIRTIGQLEPSYVIQKFLDAQRIYNLTHYLEKLHEKGLATADHTTLLLNCYTKLKDVAKLDEFIKLEEGKEGEHHFDVEVAIRVCRAAGYHQHALFVAKKAGEHERYLKILLEDLGHYEEALGYISGLPLYEAALTLKEYGKILVGHRPEDTTAALLKLCTNNGRGLTIGDGTSGAAGVLPSPMDFVHVYIDQPKWLMKFLEQYVESVKDSASHVEIHNTLLELYLSEELRTPVLSQQTTVQQDAQRSPQKAGGWKGKSVKGAGSPVLIRGQSPQKLAEQSTESTEEVRERRLKALALLKSGWGPHEQQPRYDVDLAVVLCQMHVFKDGLLYLYEKMKLYKEVMACYMKDGDYAGLISCCKRLGDSSRGGDASLWADALAYFGEKGENCTKEVKEVLFHIERDNLLPPLIVIQTLGKNQSLTLSVIKDYIANQLQQETKVIEEDRAAIDKYQVTHFATISIQ